MSDREKLIELLEDAESAIYWSSNNRSFIEDIADHLISNGVTVQKWIPVSERLPEEDGLYITFGCTAVPVRWLHNFDKDMRKFGVWWNYEPDGKEHPRYRFIEADSITHWMPMPLPPKECE